MGSDALAKTQKDLSNPSVQKWFDSLSSLYSPSVIEKIRSAYLFADKAHKGQIRKSGEAYIFHPLGVASILVDLNLDPATVMTALLHDTVEDTEVTLECIRKEFGPHVEKLVDGVTKISKMRFTHFRQKQGENIRKMILAMGKDVRVILVKMADRLHNMKTLHYVSYEKQERIAQETLDIYVPLAGRLGMGSMKIELEDLSFRFLHPHNYYELIEKVNKNKEDREKLLSETKNAIHENLIKSVNFAFEVSGRAKSFYSIYKKMELKNITYSQLYDTIAFRVCIEKVSECYEILGLIHSFFKPVPGRFKDFIAMPKSNGYQSLHTTVIGSSGEKIEIQIRTHKMHQIAEFGIAAHWKYKEKNFSDSIAFTNKAIEKFNWYRQLINKHQNTENLENVEEFLDNIETDLIEDEIYVFTPKGEVRELPEGSTPIDFAFSIHTDLGHTITSARVNGRLVPLRSVLKSGDRVEVITSKNQSPSKDWLKHCVTSKAKSKIRHFIKTEERKRALQVGQDLLNQKFNQMKLSMTDYLQGEKFQKFKTLNGCMSLDDFYVRIGYGKIPCHKVMEFLIPKGVLEEKNKRQKDIKSEDTFTKEDLLLPPSSSIETQKKKNKGSSSLIIVDGMKHLMVNYAKCCNPIPGDEISGFLTYGRGITIHRLACKQTLAMDSDRRVEVTWNVSPLNQNIKRTVLLKIVCFNQRGLLKSMSEIISLYGVDINGANIRLTQDKNAICVFHLALKDAQQLNLVTNALKKLKGVFSVNRVSSSA